MSAITLAELAERGMDDRLAAVLNALIGDRLNAPDWLALTPDEMAALGYGPPCECWERGLERGETRCSYPACEEEFELAEGPR